MTIKERVIGSLVDDWNQALKWASVQFAFLAGIIVTYATTDPEGYAHIMGMLPQEVRIPLGLLVSTILPIYLRVRKQGEKDG